jgi:hypothetical protein
MLTGSIRSIANTQNKTRRHKAGEKLNKRRNFFSISKRRHRNQAQKSTRLCIQLNGREIGYKSRAVKQMVLNTAST